MTSADVVPEAASAVAEPGSMDARLTSEAENKQVGKLTKWPVFKKY
jgi:hypothetical protein